MGGVFIGLVCVYAVDFFASLKPDLPKLGGLAERAVGFFPSRYGILAYVSGICRGAELHTQVHAAALTAVRNWPDAERRAPGGTHAGAAVRPRRVARLLLAAMRARSRRGSLVAED